MIKGYLTLDERIVIASLLEKNQSYTTISKILGRNLSTISKEVRRNSVNGVYQPAIANDKVQKRLKERKSRSSLNEELIEYIYEKLCRRWSPEQIVGYAKNHDGLEDFVCVKTIYRWIKKGYIQPQRNMLKYLRRKGKKYKNHVRLHYRKSNSILKRSKQANLRLSFGNWEVDTIVSPYRSGGGSIVTLVERKSRFLKASIVREKTASEVEKAILEMLIDEKAKTITSDNGGEFANYHNIEKLLNVEFYFAEPYKSYQRGTNENTNGLLREYFPKGTVFEDTMEQRMLLDFAVSEINNRPFKMYNFKTRKEIHEKLTKMNI